MNSKTLIAASIFVLLALGYFYSVLDGSLLLTERDLAVFFIPPRLLWVEAVRGLQLPLWNPYSYSGAPLLATLQPGVFYPINVLLLLLPFDLAFNWTIIVHFPLAGLFTYALLRDLGSTRSGSLAGGLVFMLSGYLFSVHNVMSTLFTVTWTPLALLAFRRAAMRGSTACAALAGVVLAVMFTGGGIEVLFGTIILVFVLALAPTLLDFSSPTTTYAPAPRRVGYAATALAVMLALSAVQLLPFLELAGRSIRTWGLSYAEATTWSFDLKDFLHFFIPDPYGYGVNHDKYWSNQSWLKTVYTGAIPFILAFFFLARARTRALPMVLVGVVFLTLAMGRYNPLYPFFFNYLPFFSKIRYPVKFLFVPFLFLAIASGVGLDALARTARGGGGGPGHARLLPAAFLVLSTAGALAFGALSFFDPAAAAFLTSHGIDYPEYNRVDINLFNAKRVVFFFVASTLAVYGGLKSPRLRRAAPCAVIVLLAVDLFFAHRGYYATTPAEEYHSTGRTIGLVKQDPGLFRVFATPRTLRENMEIPADGPFDIRVIRSMRLDKERITGYNIEHWVFDIDGFGVMRRADYSAVYTLLVSQEAPDSTNLLALMNVKYVVSIPEIDSDEFRLVKVIGAAEGEDRSAEKEKALKVYENLNFLPRFFFAGDFKVIKDPKEYVTTLASKEFDPGGLVLLEETPEPAPASGTGKADGGKSVTVEEYRLNSVRLKAFLPAPAILVASESWYPGWRVYVDGERARLLKADYVYRAVALPAGEHEVEFLYRPLSFTIGLVISGLTAAALLAAGALALRKAGTP
ncbi:MAG: YfhO family protein [Thermodesulfobacteriota bacterium]